MEQERSKKRREKKGPGTIPDAPTLQDFYIDPSTRLTDNPGDGGGNGLSDGIKNIKLDDEAKPGDSPLSDHDGSRSRNTEMSNFDPGGIQPPLVTLEGREAQNFESSAPELVDSVESSAPPMDLSELEENSTREISAHH